MQFYNYVKGKSVDYMFVEVVKLKYNNAILLIWTSLDTMTVYDVINTTN